MADRAGFFLATQFLFLSIGIALAHHPHVHARYTHILLGCTGVVSAYGLMQFVGWDFLPARLVFQQAGRITATFENPNYFGDIAAFVLSLSACLFLTGRRSILYLLLSALLYTGVLLSGSRGAWAAALFGAGLSATGVFISYRGLPRAHQLARIAVLIFAFVSITLGFSNRPILTHAGKSVAVGERLLSARYVFTEAPAFPGELSQQSLSHRRWIWQITWDMVRSRPLIGRGLGGFKTAFAAQRTQTESSPTAFENVAYAHNEWLHIAAEAGLIGALGFSMLVFGLVGRALQPLIKNGPDPQCWGLLGCIGALLFHSLMSYPLRLPLNGMVFWVALGLLTGQATPPETRHKEDLTH